MTRKTRFSIPEAMLPYFMFALWDVAANSSRVTATHTPKGYDIEYEMSREDDSRVRALMTKVWKDRNLPTLDY